MYQVVNVYDVFIVTLIQWHVVVSVEYYTNATMIILQIGLWQIQTWKNVEYRKFNFERYPKYFEANLRMVGWKPIVIQVSPWS